MVGVDFEGVVVVPTAPDLEGVVLKVDDVVVPAGGLLLVGEGFLTGIFAAGLLGEAYNKYY